MHVKGGQLQNLGCKCNYNLGSKCKWKCKLILIQFIEALYKLFYHNGSGEFFSIPGLLSFCLLRSQRNPAQWDFSCLMRGTFFQELESFMEIGTAFFVIKQEALFEGDVWRNKKFYVVL